MRINLSLVVMLAVACSSNTAPNQDAGTGGTGTGGTSDATGGTGGSNTGGTGTGGTVDTGTGGTGGTGTGGTGTGGMGMPDPCATVANACTTAGAKCSGKSLTVCAKNADGCLVSTTSDCTKNGTNFCEASAATPECAKCSDLDAACSTAGKTCDADTLVTCAADANGCLVETTTDCATVTGKPACSETAKPGPACQDPCVDDDGKAKANMCVKDETGCADDILVTCVKDGLGCPIATRTDCTKVPGKNFCNGALATPDCDNDPCLGKTDCLTLGTTCDGNNKVECALVDGCNKKTVTDCTKVTDKTACGEVSAGVFDCEKCADACTPAGKTCDVATDTLTDCVDTDANGCLDKVAENCGSADTTFTCDVTDGCKYTGTGTCDGALETTVLREPKEYGPFDTTGKGNDFASFSACPTLSPLFPIPADGPDILFPVDVAPGTVITITFKDVAGFDTNIEPGLLLLTACKDAIATIRVYLVVDASNAVAGTPNDGTFSLVVTTRPLGCGDGKRDGAEECDDGNIFTKDGCSTDCKLETGYKCTAGSPSVCSLRPTDNICANVKCDTAPANTTTCCTSGQVKCGLASEFVYGAGCFERSSATPAGDTRCKAATSILELFFPSLPGCCRAVDKQCGFAVPNAGCVERTEVSRNMQDGAGAFFYGGPYEAVGCP
jgi:cysteine-rich repeat protein